MPRPDHHTHLRAVATALFVTMLWSSSWILIRVGLDDEALEPITFAGLRYTLAAVVLMGWTASRRDHRHRLGYLDRSTLERLVVLGIVFFAVTQGAQFVAIDNQPAATASLMLAPTPLLVAAFAGRTLAERATVRQFVGATLVVVGAVFYFSGDLGATAVGMAASIVGLAAGVAGALLGRSVNRTAHVAPVVVTTVSMTVGAVLLLSAGVVLEGWPSLTPKSIVIIAWLAVVNTAIAFTLWNHSLRCLAAVESAAINNTMLIQIAILAWLFLGETISAREGAGLILAVLGVVLVQLAGVRSQEENPATSSDESGPKASGA